jgi:hypothetical protein
MKMVLTGTVLIHQEKTTGEREAEAELGHELGWGGYAIVLVWKVVGLQKDFEETWAYRGEVGAALALVEEAGVEDALAWVDGGTNTHYIDRAGNSTFEATWAL